ncbi:hypothetical protein CspeluHIS016_0303350 [Cutaneotrichosporon spelunceum]|uniref:Uncharacterized protein n=1 Tax=Cutaneotrichosporon spelunceum TaxID=1672016 RepID=A0AAD3YAY3_9TREE|nr:hypothetical protein CspeluHIS016_0303350 [Cutaneotrichosporon spelunceum]
MSKQTPYSLRHDALHNAVSKSASSHLPQGTTQHLQTDDASRERRNARGLELFKAMNLVINEAPLEVLLPLRQTCHSLYQRADGRLLWHFAVGPDGIDLAARRKNELDIDIHSPNTEPRHVLDIRGPDEGCIGCNTDAVSERLRCTCIRKRLRQLRCLSGIRFDMVRVWVNSNQNLGNFQRGEDNILKAQTTVYIVDIDHKPNKAVYLPTAPIGGSPEVTIIMVVDPAATGELSAQSHFASGQPNPNATYSYLFASNNPSWYSIPTTNNWPGAPVNDEIAFMDVFMVHFAQIQLATKPAWTYLVGSEVWPSDWLAAHRLQEDDWEQKYDVAVQNYVQERVFPLLVRVDAVRKHVQGVFKADEMMHAVTAAGRSYGWQTLAEFDERWQAKHGLPLSFVLCC